MLHTRGLAIRIVSLFHSGHSFASWESYNQQNEVPLVLGARPEHPLGQPFIHLRDLCWSVPRVCAIYANRYFH